MGVAAPRFASPKVGDLGQLNHEGFCLAAGLFGDPLDRFSASYQKNLMLCAYLFVYGLKKLAVRSDSEEKKPAQGRFFCLRSG
jgi:hypothetical protein